MGLLNRFVQIKWIYIVMCLFWSGGIVNGNIICDLRTGDKVLFVGDSMVLHGIWPDGFVHKFKEILFDHNISVSVDTLSVAESRDSMSLLHEMIVKRITNSYRSNGISAGGVNSQLPTTVILYAGTDHAKYEGTSTDYVSWTSVLLTELRKQSDFQNIILATPSIIGEKYDTTNQFDNSLEEMSAEAEGIIDQLKSISATNQTFGFIDLYFSTIKRLERVNYENLPSFVLTYDGQHFNKAGSEYVASLFASAVCRNCHRSWVDSLTAEEDNQHVPLHAKLNPQFFSSLSRSFESRENTQLETMSTQDDIYHDEF